MNAYSNGAQTDIIPALFDASAFVLLFFLTVFGFYIAKDMKNSFGNERPPKLEADTLLAGAVVFFLIAFRGFVNLLQVIQWKILNAEMFTPPPKPLDALSDILLWSFIVLLGMTIGKLALNAGLEIEPHERATPHILKRFGIGKKAETEKSTKKKRK